jgi:EAL and modified HD-GYP domain-containing signal transduction protein
MAAASSPQVRAHARNALFARQPICDDLQRVVGYELLHRGFAGDGLAATSSVLVSALGDIGLDATIGATKAWVNVEAQFLLEIDPLPFGPERIVLELLEGAEPTRPLLERMQLLRNQGFSIALDDFTWDQAMMPLVRLADVIKLDVLALGVDGVAQTVKMLAPFRKTIVAEKVEDVATAEACRAAGATLFQGYWFCRPELVSGRPVPAVRRASLSAVSELSRPDAGLEEIQRAVTLDAGLSLRLLRHLNSAWMALPHRVGSVHQAVVMFGERRMKQWAMLHVLAGITGGREALLTVALVRARTAELIAGLHGADDTESWFASGLLSVSDALTCAPMNEIVSELPLADAVRSALLERTGPMGEALNACERCEHGTETDQTILGLYAEAVAWAQPVAVAAASVPVEESDPAPALVAAVEDRSRV